MTARALLVVGGVTALATGLSVAKVAPRPYHPEPVTAMTAATQTPATAADAVTVSAYAALAAVAVVAALVWRAR